jgi:hypothetical protein
VATAKKNAKKRSKKPVDICICKVCKHNMGRSRCKPTNNGWVVRCNKCKTYFEISVKKAK